MPSFGFCRVVLEGRLDVVLVLDEALRAVSLLQVLLERLADALAVGDVARLEADDGLDDLLGEDRVALDLDGADAIELALADGDGDAQAFVHGGEERQRQTEARAAAADALDARLAVRAWR